MPKSSSKAWNENKQGMLFWPELAQKWIFSAQTFLKTDLGLEILKTNVGTKIRYIKNRNTLCASFPAKRTILNFLVQIYSKMDLGLKMQKINIGMRISNLEIPCVPIFRQNGQLWLFQPKFTQKWILGSEFKKSKFGSRISTSKIPCVPIFSQSGQLWIFWPESGEIAQLHAIFWF